MPVYQKQGHIKALHEITSVRPVNVSVTRGTRRLGGEELAYMQVVR